MQPQSVAETLTIYIHIACFASKSECCRAQSTCTWHVRSGFMQNKLLFTAPRARSRPQGVCASVCLRSVCLALSVCLSLSGVSVSVCQSVCLSRAGQTDEHTHDVKHAVFPGLHSRHREQLVRSHINPTKHSISRTSKAPEAEACQADDLSRFFAVCASLHNASAPSVRADLLSKPCAMRFAKVQIFFAQDLLKLFLRKPADRLGWSCRWANEVSIWGCGGGCVGEQFG